MYNSLFQLNLQNLYMICNISPSLLDKAFYLTSYIKKRIDV